MGRSRCEPVNIATVAPARSAALSAKRNATSEDEPVRVVPPKPTIKGTNLSGLVNSGTYAFGDTRTRRAGPLQLMTNLCSHVRNGRPAPVRESGAPFVNPPLARIIGGRGD